MGDDDKAVDKILRDWYVGAVDIVPAPRSLVDGVIAAETEPQKLYSDMATLLGWYLEKGCPPELFVSAFCRRSFAAAEVASVVPTTRPTTSCARVPLPRRLQCRD